MTNYYEFKRSAANFNISIDDSEKDLSRSVFVGLGFGVFLKDRLVCAFPKYPNDASMFESYKEALSTLSTINLSFKKIALYQFIKNKQYFAVKGSNRSKYMLANRLKCLSQGQEHDLHCAKSQIKVYFEDTNSFFNVGSLDKVGKHFSFIPVIVFNHGLFSPELQALCIPILSFLGKGDYMCGNWVIQQYTSNRMLLVDYFPKHMRYGREIRQVIYSDELKLLSRKYNYTLNRDEAYLIGERWIKKSLFYGDAINFDWFGQEHGFYLKDNNDQTQRFLSDTVSDKSTVMTFSDNIN